MTSEHAAVGHGATQTPRHVLVVEEWAHRAEGHFPSLFAEISAGFAEAGCSVDVLLQRDWVYEQDWDLPVRFAIHRYRRIGRGVSRVAGLVGDGDETTRWGRLRRASGSIVRAFVVTREVRALGRRLGRPLDTVIVMSALIDPLPVAALGGRRSWLIAKYRPPLVGIPLLSRAFDAAARRSEARRRKAGRRVRIVTAGADSTEGWERRTPYLAPATTNLAVATVRVPVADARARLGIGAAERVALLFGADHWMKDADVVWRAFSGMDDWRLIAGGRITDTLSDPTIAGFARAPLVVRGHVSRADRDLLYSSADVVVLSFRESTVTDSGGLVDAVGWGLPVVCSDGSVAADAVREHRLGELFEPGDETSLRAAVRSVPRSIAPEDLARARARFSTRVTAERFLELLRTD